MIGSPYDWVTIWRCLFSFLFGTERPGKKVTNHTIIRSSFPNAPLRCPSCPRPSSPAPATMSSGTSLRHLSLGGPASLGTPFLLRELGVSEPRGPRKPPETWLPTETWLPQKAPGKSPQKQKLQRQTQLQRTNSFERWHPLRVRRLLKEHTLGL